jgi:hypothetical protein
MADEDPRGTISVGDAESFNDADSGYTEQYELSTASVSSSIYDYEEEYGRSYHAFRRGKYVMPNDDREQERMDIHYHAVRLAFDNRHYFALLQRPTFILDVGTGTGIVSRSMWKRVTLHDDDAGLNPTTSSTD